MKLENYEKYAQTSNFEGLINFLSRYEEGALAQYAYGITSKFVAGNTMNPIYIGKAKKYS